MTCLNVERNWLILITSYIQKDVSLTHRGRVMHICIGNLATIGSDNGLSPRRRQAIIWTKAGILLIGPWGTNFSEILISIQSFSFKKMHLKMASAKWRPFCLGLNVLSFQMPVPHTHGPGLGHQSPCSFESLFVDQMTPYNWGDLVKFRRTSIVNIRRLLPKIWDDLKYVIVTISQR